MNRALNAVKCSAAGIVLLHATDLNPLWLIEPYRRLISSLVFYNRFTAIMFLIAIFVALGVVISCSDKARAQTMRSA